MQNLLIVDSEPDFLDKVSRALVKTGHRFLARCKCPESALAMIEARQKSPEPVKIVLVSAAMNEPGTMELVRKLKQDFSDVAVLVAQQDDATGTAIDVFSASDRGWPGNSMVPLDAQGLSCVVNEAVVRYAEQNLDEQAIGRLGARLREWVNSPDLIERFLEEVLAFLEVESGSIFLFDEKRKRMVLVAARSGDGLKLVGMTKGLGEGVAGYVAQEKKPLLVVSRDAAPIAIGSPHRKYETESFICAPIINRTRLIGVLNLTEKKSKKPFNEGDLDLVMAIVNEFSANIEQAFHHMDLRTKNRKLSAAMKKASARLRERNAMLSYIEAFNTAVVSNIPLGVVVLDGTLSVRSANASFRELFTERGKEIVGGPLAQALGSVSMEGRKLLEEKVRLAMREEETCTSGFVCLMADGTRAIFNMSTRTFGEPRDSREKLLLVIIEDVTEDVLLKTKIARSQRLAEMGELVAGVAHEINNPLDGIMRFTNIALKKASGDQLLEECFSETKNGLERISRIIKSLMQYTRNSNKTFVETDANQLLDNILVLMSYMQTKRNIRIVRRFDPQLPAIRARSNLDQVFINLVKNAFEAMEPGGTLEIATFFDDGSVFIRLKDTGCGIPGEILCKLGERFVTTKENGTGIGITMCKEIIKEHGGELTVKSEVGVGSCFTVRLPQEQHIKEE